MGLIYRLAAVITAVAAGAVVLLDACSRQPQSGSPAAMAPPDQVHVVRGRIVQLPEAGKPAHSLQIHHEPIEHYKRPDGSLGMNAMVMPFNPAEGLDLSGLAIGDVVEFRWEVRRRENGPSLLTSIKELPPDTVLNLGKTGGG